MNTTERIETFQRELSYILDPKVKEFTKALLTEADDYFFTVPASSSGKYHPPFAKGEGGLVRHTKAVAYFLNELLRPNIEFDKISRYEGDLLICAAIAHDIKKQGDGTEGHTVKEHPHLAAEFVMDVWKKYGKKLISEDGIEYIYDAIYSHMGPWSDPKPVSLPQLLVFYADFIASRKEITGLDFIENGDNSAVEAYEKPVYTVEGYKFDFGKTKGMTIKEAYDANPGYIKWIAGKEDFGMVEVRNLVKEFLRNI
jgi:HD superfamily phosphohydrolase YqeK